MRLNSKECKQKQASKLASNKSSSKHAAANMQQQAAARQQDKSGWDLFKVD